ncbi:MAG: alanine racemase [Candidatus Dormibacteria bacterium]
MSGAVTDGLLRWVEIDTRALQHNVRTMRALLRPSTRVMAMVKSDGYGHGAVTVARAAHGAGATWLGVYTPDEALALRAAGIDGRMLVTGWSPPSTVGETLAHDVDLSICDLHDVSVISEAAQARAARVHVKLDTGLGRLGLREDEIDSLATALRDARGRLEVAGIFTHFAEPDDVEFTTVQHQRFAAWAARLRVVAPEAVLHAGNSEAIITAPETQHDIVRVGIATYGYISASRDVLASLRPVMTMRARVAQVKRVPSGEPIGYGRTWSAPTDRWIATVAAGYGQGIPRLLSNSGQLVVNGRRVPIVGTVSMDQVTVDVTDVMPVAAGDIAMVFGERDGVRLGAHEVAALAGTISYEVLTGVPQTVARVVTGDGDASAVL